MPLVNRYSAVKQAVITSTGNTLVLCEAGGGFGSVDLTTPAGGRTKDWRLDGSSAVLNILPGSNILYAELIWYSSVLSYGGPNLTGVQDTPISFTTPDLVVHPIAPQNTETYAGANQISRFRSNSIDITPLIQANGSGTYTVSGVPTSICPDCNSDNSRGGWQLIVAYENEEFPFRSLSVNTGLQPFDESTPINFVVGGFATPAAGPVGGRLLLCAADGDPNITGEKFSAGPNDAGVVPLGNPVLTPNPNPGTAPNNPQNNIFAGQVNISDPLNPNVGLIDTSGTFGGTNHDAFVPTIVPGARNKWDITNLDIVNALANSQTQLVVKASVDGAAGAVEVQSIGLQINVNSAQLSPVTKTVNLAEANVGEVLTYTITFTNNGLASADHVVLTDVLPDGTAFEEGSLYIIGDSAGITSTSPLVVELDHSVAPGESRTIGFNVVVNAIPVPNPIRNKVKLDYDFIPAVGIDPIKAAIESTPVETFIINADLVVTKGATPDPVIAGELLTYTIDIKNNGPSSAETINFIDVVDRCITNPEFFIAGNPIWYAWNGGPLPIGNIDNGASKTVKIRGIVDPSCLGSVSNTATVISPTADPTPDNRTTTITTTINTRANLVIKKTDHPDPVIAGEVLTYLVTVTNNGPSDAQDVVLTDAIPSCVTNPEVSTNGLDWKSWNAGGVPLGVVESGETVKVWIRGTIDSACLGTISNTATVISPTPDPTPETRTTTEKTQINAMANLVITKIDEPDPVSKGAVLTYRLKVANNGPSDAQDVVVTDAVPSCIKNLEVSKDGINWEQWSEGNDVTSSLGTIKNDNFVTVWIRGTVDSTCTGSINNTATVTSPTPDPTPGTRTTTAKTIINTMANVVITKTGQPDPVYAGELLTYTLTVTNNGPSAAQDINLIDVVPSCVTNPEFKLEGGSWKPWDGGPLPLGMLAKGDTITLWIRGMIEGSCEGIISNTAKVVSPTPDPNPETRITTEETRVDGLADLVITKTDQPDPVHAGELLTYTLTVTNKGPSDAKNVMLNDVMPECIMNPEYSTDDGFNWYAWSGTISLGTLMPTTTMGVRIRGRVDPSCHGQIVNKATVTSSTPAPNPDDRTTTQTTTVKEVANLTITKSAAPDVVDCGTRLTYTINITNEGPSTATDTTLIDIVDSNLSEPVYSLDGHDWFMWMGTLPLGDIAPQKTITVFICGVVTAHCGCVIINRASVVSTTPPVESSDRTATVQTPIVWDRCSDIKD